MPSISGLLPVSNEKFMDPRSEVILRQVNYLKGKVLFIHAPNDQLLSTLDTSIESSIWTWNYADHQAQIKNGYISYFDVSFPQQVYDQVVIYVPKSKELLNYILYQVASHLPQKSQIFLVGEKKGGVERAAKQLKAYGETKKLDSARHCQFWQTTLEKIVPIKPLTDWLQQYHIANHHIDMTIYSLPGVFSQNHLDIGTAVLLPYLEQVKSGTLADFGCGAGVISCYLAKLSPNNIVHALDVDAFALASTKITFERNNIPPNQFYTHAVTGIEDAPSDLDAIVSNPPFHQGIHTNYDASEGLCRQAKKHLKTQGELWIVANRFLNYSTLIEKYVGTCTVKADQQGFKVLYANNAKF